MEIEELQRTRERLTQIAGHHADILHGFWNDEVTTFGQYGPNDAGHHVTTACTCVLSFLDVPLGTLPNFLERHRNAFLTWLLKTSWSSEGLGEGNPYTAPLALTTALKLADHQILDQDRARSGVYAVRQHLNSGSGAVEFMHYPPSGFLTYWTIRALIDALAHYRKGWWNGSGDEVNATEQAIKRAALWAEEELHRHIAYYTANDLDRYDALQLGYAMAIVDFIWAVSGQDPSRDLIAAGLRVFFASQLSNGLWAKAFPLFHYPDAGSVYPFSFETLTAVMRIGSRDASEHVGFPVEFFEPHLEGLNRALSWAESHQLSENGLRGWRSNNVLPGTRPQAWATAMVLAFVRGFDILLQRMIQRRLLQEFSARQFPRHIDNTLTAQSWCNLADSPTPIIGSTRSSVKQLLFDYLVQPHLPDPSPQSIQRRRWSAVFFGPPGTGKTKLVSEMARALGWPLLTIETSDLLALGVDRMAHQARLIFRKLEQLREVVIFIDEVEEFVRKRNDKEDRESRLITTAMLTLIQGLRSLERSILVLATNHVDTFDPAILRPGRFDLLVLIKPPGLGAKIQAWSGSLGKANQQIAEKVFGANAEVVERFTFEEWRTFVERCKHLSDDTGRFQTELERELEDAARSLTIDPTEWARWTNHKSRIN